MNARLLFASEVVALVPGTRVLEMPVPPSLEGYANAWEAVAAWTARRCGQAPSVDFAKRIVLGQGVCARLLSLERERLRRDFEGRSLYEALTKSALERGLKTLVQGLPVEGSIVLVLP